jgi:hypothetical protein
VWEVEVNLCALFQRIHPNRRPYVTFRDMLVLYGEEFTPHPPTPQAGGPHLIGCSRLIFQCIRRFPSYLKAFSPIPNLRTHHTVPLALDGHEWSYTSLSRFTPLGKKPRYLLDRRLGVSKRWPGRCGVEKNPHSCLEWYPSHPARGKSFYWQSFLTG